MMTANKPKKLTLTEIRKQDDLLNGQKTVYVLDNKYAINIDKRFRKTKMDKYVAEYISIVQEVQKAKQVSTDDVLNIPYAAYGLAAKHFTDLPIEYKSLDGFIVVTRRLLDLGILEQLFSGNCEEGFDPSEVERLNKTTEAAATNVGQAMGELAIREALNQGDA